MKLAITRLSAGLLGGTMLLLASACATGTRAGGSMDRDSIDDFVLQAANANANMLQWKLLYLDKEDYKGLREAIDSELDSELLAICAMMRESSFGSSHSREIGRAILGRIAKYRSQQPQSYSPASQAYTARVDENAKTKLQSCFDESLAASGR